MKTKLRQVVVGDVHGELAGLQEILKHAALVDDQLNWNAGEAVLVQTGDVIDRGPCSVECIDLLRRLQSQAAVAGGEVVRLCGNHELMLLQGNHRYVNFPNPELIREQLQEEILSDRAVAAHSDGERLYTHAGLRTSVRWEVEKGAPPSSRRSSLRVLARRLNGIFKKAVQTGDLKSHPIFHVDRERGGSHEVGGIFWCDYSQISASEQAFDIPQIFGHTPTGRSRVMHCRGLKLIDIDAGMCRVYGGRRVYLEIIAGGRLIEHARRGSKWEQSALNEGS